MASVLDPDVFQQPTPIPGSAVKPFINITPKPLGVLGPNQQNKEVAEEMRGFTDIDKTRQSIYDSVLQAANEMPEFSNNRFKMRLVNAQYTDSDKPSIAERKKAILRQETLDRRLQGTWQLLDHADNIVDERTVTMARIPKMTNGGTFVLNGVEYTLANQARLRPGVFTREKQNGEIESHVNVMPGKGVSHRYTLDPAKGTFKMTLGQASIPLFPLLKAMGAKDSQLREAWGNELYEVNAKNNDPQAVDKISNRMLRKADMLLDSEGRVAKLREMFNKMELDDVVTGRTLGKPYKNLSIDAMMDATRKILAVQRREAEPDDRDAMAYQMIYGPEDFFAEKVRSAYKVMNPMLWKATFRGNLGGLAPNFLGKHVNAALLSSGLGQPSEEVNSAEILGQLTRMSRLGEGGIPSLDAVPDEARSVQPSHFGYVDPLLTPESLKVGVDSRLAANTMKGKNGKVYAKFLDVKTGEPVWKTPQDVADSVIAFPKELDDKNADTVAALVSGKIKYVPRDSVEFTLPHMEDSFNPLVNMIPLKSTIKGQRVMMGARMLTQALPLRNAEAPYVQAGVPGDKDESFEERYGNHMGAINSNVEGQVVSVSPDSIGVKGPDGKVVEHELHNNLPYNRKTYLHNTPVVKTGDMVNKNTLLAKSNYTNDTGATALGLNLRTAYIPYKGANFEDAIVVSEAAAKRLSSEHMYQHDTEFEKGLKHGKKNFISMFPATYDRKIMDSLDDDGVVKPGTVVNKDMPIILQIKEKERAHNQITRGRSQLYNDSSITWDHHDPGVVTDVEKTKKGIVVTVKGYAEMQVGDKLSGRYGDKGVIAEIVPDDKMPRDKEGRPFEVLVNPLGVITRCYDEQTEFLTQRGWLLGKDVQPEDKLLSYHTGYGHSFWADQLSAMHSTDYQGRMIGHRNKVTDFLVTPNHSMWVRAELKESTWGEKTAGEIFGKRYVLPAAASSLAAFGSPFFILPGLERNGIKDTSNNHEELRLNAKDWAELLGWFMAEGNVTYDEINGEYRTHIAQSDTVKPFNCKRIAELLNRLPFKWNYGKKNKQFHISSKQLAHYLRQFGYSHEKFIPDWLFVQEDTVRKAFLDGYWAGDGSVRKNKKGSVVSTASSVSKRLVEDLHRLLTVNGETASIHDKKEKEGCKQAWTISRSSKKTRTTRNDSWYEITDYDGKVYCPNVSSGYVFTRRNGKVIIAGNTNPGQMVEAALGKIVEKTGKRYAVKDFSDITDMVQFAKDELKKHGLSDLEDIEDPDTNHKIGNVFTGNRFFMKLHHMAEHKGSGRGLGSYTAEDAPAKGGPMGSKRVSLADNNALLSHGALEVLTDAGSIRGQKNQDYWAAFMAGKTPPAPKIPFVYNKFFAQLKAAGINPVRNGPRIQVMALTGKDIDHLAENREITSAETVDWKEGLKPIKGGLFDDTLTGGHNGNRWSYIKLAEPMPNPVMEEPIRRVLGLTQKKFQDVLAGREAIGDETGPAAIQSALKRINLTEAVRSAEDEWRSGKKSTKDAALKRWSVLKHTNKLGMHPSDWMLDKIPVLPPAFRPVSIMGATGKPLVADANYLYKEAFEANDALKDTAKFSRELGDERTALYKSFKAVTGLGDPVSPKNQERQVKGVLKYVFGDNPKFSIMQRKLLSKTVDVVGRGVITPNPDLDMDQVGLPETKAWEIYKPFIVRRLSKRGISPIRAAELVESKDKTARDALLQEMENRPVIITRAPVLHRYGVMAFRPQLVKSETLQIPPAIVTGFGADFDGDTMNYHVPVSDGAVKDALEKMLPSKNLLAAKSFKAHQLPKNEYQGGLYHATAFMSNKPERYFATKADAIRAYRNGEIGSDQKVVILN